MKKIIFLIPLVMLLITGCGSDKVICTLKTDSTVNDFSMDATYTIQKDGEYVKAISTIERYTADNVADLKSLAETAKNQYAEYNKKYSGYVYSFNINGNTLEAKVIINYNKMDFKQYMSDNPAVAAYAKNDKLTVEGAINLYKAMGATCN